jgi:hypothetical protein
MEEFMADDEVSFDATNAATAATSLAELVAEVARLSSSIEWQRQGVLLAQQTMGFNSEVDAELPAYRQRLADTEARLNRAKAELAKGFAAIMRG